MVFVPITICVTPSVPGVPVTVTPVDISDPPVVCIPSGVKENLSGWVRFDTSD